MSQMESGMEEKIVCAACGKEFLYTDRERKFLEDLVSQGKLEEVKTPRRCLSCRAEMRRQKPPPSSTSRAPREARPAGPQPVSPPVAAPPSVQASVKELPSGAPCPDELVILVASDFEQLVCREEVVWRQGNRKIRIRLADIGIEAMKKAMERALLRWWKS